MMKIKLFKNKEICSFTIILAVIALVVSSALLFVDPLYALLCAALLFVFILIFLVFYYKRYKMIASLSADLEKMLDGNSTADLSRYSEGELSILENRLAKLVSHLHSQTAELAADKLMLANSIADISHQIKTPLTSINLLSAALSKPDESFEDGEKQRMLASMHAQIDKMDWLVSSLLKLAKFDADAVEMKPASLPLDRLIRLAAEPLEILLELRQQNLSVEAFGSVYCDQSWTCEAIMNIIKNCSECMGEGVIGISAHENPLYSEIVISDGGKGIDKDDLPHIFERFYRGKSSSSAGFGIGLALSRSIITKQNGTVKAENSPNGGAVFTIRFYKSAV